MRAAATTLILTGIISIGLAGSARAQSDAERVRISVNAGIQPTAHTVSQDFNRTINLETAPISVDIDLKSSPFFDVGATVKVAGRLGVGGAVSSLSRSSDADVAAKIPHPFFFNLPRSISGTVSDMKESEMAIHLAVVYFIPVTTKLEVGVFGGPSWIMAKQDLITDVTYSESYPFDTATLTSASSTNVSKTAVGYNAGADVSWRLSKALAVGGLLRFTAASATLSAGSGNEATADLGGLQAGAGIRLIF